MTTERPAEDPSRTPAPDPSERSQVDIASDVQSGLADSSDARRDKEAADDASTSSAHEPGAAAPASRATQFDGNPNPEPASDSPSGIKPQDDTPWFLEKREGPKE